MATRARTREPTAGCLRWVPNSHPVNTSVRLRAAGDEERDGVEEVAVRNGGADVGVPTRELVVGEEAFGVHELWPGGEAERVVRVREHERRRLARDVDETGAAEHAGQLTADRAVAEIAIAPKLLDLAEQGTIGDVGDERLLVGIDRDDPSPRACHTYELVHGLLGSGHVLEHAVD